MDSNSVLDFKERWTDGTTFEGTLFASVNLKAGVFKMANGEIHSG